MSKKINSTLREKDGEDAHWDDNPTSIEIEEIEINDSSSLTIYLAEGGGFAISLLKKELEE